MCTKIYTLFFIHIAIRPKIIAIRPEMLHTFEKSLGKKYICREKSLGKV